MKVIISFFDLEKWKGTKQANMRVKEKSYTCKQKLIKKMHIV